MKYNYVLHITDDYLYLKKKTNNDNYFINSLNNSFSMERKKKILIAIYNLAAGGAQKSLVSLLNTISPEFSYHIQVELKNESAECYIKSQSESNNGRELDNKLLNNLIKDKSIITKDGSLIDEKELEKFKKIDFN